MSQSMYPVLRYRDANAAIEWMKAALGMEEAEVHRDDDGNVGHAEMALDGALLMFGQIPDAEDGWMGGSAPDPLASTVSLYAVVGDPDALHRRATGAGANVVRELEDQDYGSREFSLRDPEGNLWSFGTYDPSARG